MITDAFISFFTTVVGGIFGLLPTWDVTVGSFVELGSAIGKAGSMFSQWFPVGTLALCIGVLTAARIALSGWNVIVWIWEKIPFN